MNDELMNDKDTFHLFRQRDERTSPVRGGAEL